MPEFTSYSHEIKYLTQELLKDGEDHSTDDIRSYLKRKSPNYDQFTRGMFCNALYDLARKGITINVERGVYKTAQKLEPTSVGGRVRSNVTKRLEMVCDGLKQDCTADVTELSQNDFKFIGEVKEVIDFLQSSLLKMQQY